MKNARKDDSSAAEMKAPRRKSARKTSTASDIMEISSNKSETKQSKKEQLIGSNQKTPEKDSGSKNKVAEKKENSTPDRKTENLARKIITMEEEEANNRNSATDLNEFQNTCVNVEKKISNINELKRTNSAKIDNSNDIGENKVDAILLTTNLKRLNRLTQIRGKMAKERTQEVKKKVDGLHLDLQNLLYEVVHVKKEIQRCMNFSSKDEEIDLVSVEKFYEEAPASISQPKTTKTDEHRQMLARLDWELKRRKELASEKESLVTAKKKTDGEINQKADYLYSLKPRLEQIIKASRPVQEYMEMPLEVEVQLWEKAQFLPRPLYILYIQAKAYKDVCDKSLDVLITGDLVEARSTFHADKIETAESGESETENEADADEENNRKHKKDKERLIEQQNQLLAIHPLSVCLELSKKGVYKLKMKFNHVPALHITTVNVELVIDGEELQQSRLLASSDILQDLLSDDTGKTSPNTANNYQFERLKMNAFESYVEQLGLPYFWVQWICGLNYMSWNQREGFNNVPDASLSVTHFQNVISEIKSRIQSRLSLREQVQSLEKLIIPDPTKVGMKDSFPPKLVSILSSWKTITYEEFLTLSPSNGRQLATDADVKEECFLYQATLNRESDVLDVVVVVNHGYPKQSPLMLLSLKDQLNPVNKEAELRCLENEVNSYTEEIISEDHPNILLSNMLRRLQFCFDMYCETGVQSKAKEKLYSRKLKGRDRNRPYRYHSDGYFVHR